MTRRFLPALTAAFFRRSATIALLAGSTTLYASSLAAGDPTSPGPGSPAGTTSAPPRDLSGIWDVRVTATVVGSTLLCRAVPELRQAQLDTVLKARNLKELFYAVIPDTSRAWFDHVCKPTFSGDMVWGTCRIPLTYANPCGLVADVAFRGQLRNDREFTGEGNASVTTGGPGLCPEATCPGQVRIVARRVADLPRTAPK